MAQASGIIHILVSGEATENGLTQQTDKRMAAVLARARIVKLIVDLIYEDGISNMNYSISNTAEYGE